LIINKVKEFWDQLFVQFDLPPEMTLGGGHLSGSLSSPGGGELHRW
jgi:hypothetical protein